MSQGRRLGLALVAAMALGAMAAAPAGAQAPELLPDLRGTPAEHLDIRTGADLRDLRLTTSIANGGAGAFEIFPEEGTGGDCDGDGTSTDDKLAYQRIFNDVDGNGEFDRATDTSFSTRLAGCMRFHPAHDHWHFEQFASFELRRLGTDELVASTAKVGFCLLDIWPYDPGLGGHPEGGHYDDCSPTATMGISVGWADTYTRGLPGQEIDIRNVPNGQYCLAVTGDPSNIVRETDESNNRADALVTILGNSVHNSGRPCAETQLVAQGPTAVSEAPRAARCKKKAKKGSRKPRRCRRR